MEPQAGSYKDSIIDDSIAKILFTNINQIIKLTVKNKKMKRLITIKELILFFTNVFHIKVIFTNNHKYLDYRMYKRFKNIK